MKILFILCLISISFSKKVINDKVRKIHLLRELFDMQPQERNLFQLFGSAKVKDIFKLKKELKEIKEEIAQNQKDSEELKDIKNKISLVGEKVQRVYNDINQGVDTAKSKVLSMGYS